MSLTRRALAAFAAALFLAACGGTSNGGAGGGGQFDRPGDMAVGAANAPVTLIEYASLTCGHCAAFHAEVYPALKKDYVETGKVRFIFREMPTPPVELAAGGFQVARCGAATPEQYFARIDTMFRQQQMLFESYERGAARDGLRALARAAGISDSDFEACVADEAGYRRINETVEHGQQTYNVTGTPTFVLNGEVLTDPGFSTVEGMRVTLDRAIAAAGG